MKRKQIILLAAAAIALNSAPVWSQSRTSKGESDTRLPQGEPSQAGKTPNTKDIPVGQSQSKPAVGSQTPSREDKRGESDTRLPQGEPSQAGKTPNTKDTPVGQSQSKPAVGSQTPSREDKRGESDTRLPQGEPSQAGKGPGTRDTSVDPRKAAEGSRHVSGISGQQDVRQAQEALKSQGHDPGPVDGVMGPQTRQALRAFQSSNGLKQTGMLDAATKQKLNIENSSGSAPMRGERSSTSPVGK
jgi:hypothetical protein